MCEKIVSAATLDKSPKGCDCTFVVLGDAGLKIYCDDMERDRQFDLQTRFTKRGVAPNCWFSFDFEGPDGCTQYAYYSEMAETRETLGYPVCEEIAAGFVSYLRDAFGVDWSDSHSGNVGRINGKNVLIDFGSMTGTERV